MLGRRRPAGVVCDSADVCSGAGWPSLLAVVALGGEGPLRHGVDIGMRRLAQGLPELGETVDEGRGAVGHP